MAITLQKFNTVDLAAGAPTQLVAGSVGNWTFQLLNLGPGALEVSDDSGMSSYFTLPVNMSLPVSAWGPEGVWVSAAEAGQVSVALLPR